MKSVNGNRRKPVRDLMKKLYRKHPWNRAVTFVAAVLVFITTYMLILPAITMTKNVLVCPYTVYEDPDAIILHQHDAACYDKDGVLVCTLPERKVHVHDDSCYEEVVVGYETIPMEQAIAEGRLESTADGLFGDSVAGTVDATSGTADSAVAPAVNSEIIPVEQVFSEGEFSDSSDSVSSVGNIAQNINENVSLTDTLNVDGATQMVTVPIIEKHLICGKEELNPELHVHDDSCYETVLMDNGDGTVTEGRILTCTKPVAFVHQHGEECFKKEGSDDIIVYDESPDDGLVIFDETPQVGGQIVDEQIVDEPQISEIPQDMFFPEGDGILADNSVEPSPLVVEENPVVVEESPVVVDENPVVVDENPIVVDDSPVVVDESPIVVEESPVVVEDSPVVVEPSPIIVEESPVVVEPSPVVVEDSPIIVDASPSPMVVEETTSEETEPAQNFIIVGNPPVHEAEEVVDVEEELTEESASEEPTVEENNTEAQVDESTILVDEEKTLAPRKIEKIEDIEAVDIVESEEPVSEEDVQATEVDLQAATEEAVALETVDAAEITTEAVVESSTEATTEVAVEVSSEAEENATEAPVDNGVDEDIVDVEEAETESEQETFAEISTEAVSEITTEAVVENVTEAAVEFTKEAETEAVSEIVTEITTEAVSEAVSEIATEITTEAVGETVSEIATEITTEAVSESVSEVAAETTTEASSEISSEASTETTTEAAVEASSEATTETTTEISSEASSEAPTTAVLTFDGPDYHVHLTYDSESGIPDDAKLSVVEIDPESEEYDLYLSQAKAALGLDEDATVPKKYARFFDITILDGEEEIQPKNEVKVEIIYDEPVADVKDENVNANVLHFDEEKNAQVLSTLEAGAEEGVEVSMEGSSSTDASDASVVTEDAELEDSDDSEEDDAADLDVSSIDTATDVEPADPETTVPAEQALDENKVAAYPFQESADEEEAETLDTNSLDEIDLATSAVGADGFVETEGIAFTTDSFSVFGIIYTVDFHWDVNGNTYEISVPGGDTVSLKELVEQLHILDGEETTSTNDGVEADEEQKEDAGVNDTVEQTESTDDTVDENGAEEDAVETEDTAEAEETVSTSTDVLTFINDIKNVEFSDESLVKVAQISEEITAGELKAALSLTPEYSAELTEEQIAEMNAKVLTAPDWALISLKAFDTEETLTVTMKDGEVFTVLVTDAQLKKTVIDAKGDTWEITVTYGDDAGIPDGAELKVSEILPEDEKYEELYNNAVVEACSDAKNQGIELPVLSGARLFDIEIQGEEGKIEPSAPVQVDIRLIGTVATDLASVIHFGENGIEALTVETAEIQMPAAKEDGAEEVLLTSELQEEAENKANQTDVTEVIFQTDSFSVYSVVNVTNLNSLVGNGKKYALVTGIANDPGATTGYSETWGRDYFTIIVNAHAMSDQALYDNQNLIDGLQVNPVHTYEDGSVSYVGGDPAQWEFVSAGNGQYYLSVNGKYLQRFNKGNNNDGQYGWEARLIDNRNNATPLSINVNTDGTILIHDGGYYLHNDGNGEWATRVYKFTNQGVNTNSSAYRFRVCAESDTFDSFAARKVSVQNLTVNDSFLIYRKFEDSQGNEQLFALASDGTFVRVYDGGDTLYWRETDKNIYWNYRLEGGYYCIYSTDPSTNETVYINPMHSSEPSQTITTTPSRLTLIGKDNGDYGTSLENWDQTAYDYAGLHVTVNNQGEASLSTGTRVAGTSDVFLFAVASNMPGEAAEKVETVDSEALGIHITVFDYGRNDYEYNAGDKLDSMADVVASDRATANDYQPHKANALVKPYLEEGLPSSKTVGAMTGLFTSGGSAVTYSKSGITNLFLKSYYDENGMFRYRSEDNYAYLGYNNTNFTVYRQAASPYPYDTAPGHTYYTHGHYMPFNDIDMTKHVSRLMNQYGNAYTNGEIVGELPIGDGRTYEDIYGTQGIPNFFTGMMLEADFTQLKDGKTDNGDPMVFKFTGDDDMWVYIDGVLVLDIGGIHEPLSGSIDFSTGQVTNPTGSSLAGTKTLKQIFDATLAVLVAIPPNQRTQEQKDQIEKISSIEWTESGTFADYTNHEFKAFYMERGAGASNLDIQFNLKVVRPGEVVVEKQIPEGVDKRFVNQEYKFQATFKDYTNDDEVKPLFKDQTYGVDQENKVCTGIYYKDRKDDEGNPVEVLVDNNGYFTLKAGEAAVFTMTDKKIEYTIKEVEIDTDQKTEKVEINGQVVTVNNGTAEAAYARVGDRSQLKYKNHPYLQNLNIVKHLLPAGTQAASGDVFEFRVYLETTVAVEGEEVSQLVPYSYGPYYVTKADDNGVIHYYTLTGTNNAPQDKGTDPVVCSTTGRSGSINSIPPEYTVVIPNLAVGTHFYIEERRDNIPAGYVFDHETLVQNDDYGYDEQILGTDHDIISRILARDEKDHQTFDHDTIGRIKKGKDAKSEVFNRKVNVKVQKQWLKTNGQPYTLEQARQLPGSTGAVITAELWRKKIVDDTSGESADPVTVTFRVNTSTDVEYRQVSEPVTIKNNSTLEFSLGARGTSQAQEIHTEPEYTISRSSATSNPMITYSNGRQKDSWSKYTISGITADTTVYATFDADKVSDDFVGLYIASKEEPNSTEVPVDEKVADITLNNGNDWLQQVSKEEGYTYFLRNVVEVGLEQYSYQYTFIDEPTVTTDEDGNLILSVANKYREPINITVEKVWSPELSSEEENDAYVVVELHRYAKKSKGVLEVVLKDNYGAPVQGAVFKLYKDGAEQDENYTTNVNGKIVVNNLEPGTYVFKQISTPEGYSIPDPAPETEGFVVEDNKTDPQVKQCELQNQALKTNGVATITLLDNNGDPIQGAKYNLIKREGSHEIVITEGLETNANGQITVSQLEAGTYYFFETEPPADYKLPDYWQDTDFTVVEHPGKVQTFNLSMTNDLKGKGYVEVTLIGPDDQPVSGAKFELYKGSEKLAEDITDSDGKLIFGDPDRLSPDTYRVKQVTSSSDLLPTAEAREFTILENGDPDQKKEISFTNTYRGMGTATVTLTRKDNNDPIVGAEFELYKDSVLYETKTTDSNGQLTFGVSDKLPVGNYSIKQITTAEDLEPVVNSWPFAILENGDRNQTFSWDVQNEDEAGNVTIKLWRKGGTGQWNWDQVGEYSNLKPGKTYSFTATLSSGLYPNNVWYYQDESDHHNSDSLSADQLNTLISTGWDSNTNSYHFTITPTEDDTLYSFVLVSGWGTTNIESMSMDESSRRAAAPISLRSLSRQMKLSSVSDSPLKKTVESSEQVVNTDANDEVLSVSGIKSATPATRDVPQVVSPSGPPSDDYIVDENFAETYTIKKKDNWKHVFENLDKYDQDENLYYYYVIEMDCVPESYHIASYNNDKLTETGTITITNEIRLGALSIQKTVTVNGGDVPTSAPTIADGTYTFTITGPNNYSGTETIKVTNGIAEGTIELEGLEAGTYTITETESDNLYGITLAEPKTITVNAGDKASENVVSFINNLETLDITVKKTWNGTTTWPEEDFTVDMTLNANNLTATSLPNYNGNAQTATVTLTSADAVSGKTWHNLPKYDSNGDLITYTVEESVVKRDGISITNYNDVFTVTNGTLSDGVITIDNTPKEVELEVTKVWTLNGTPRTDKTSIGFAVHSVIGSTDSALSSVWTSVGESTPAENTSPTVNYVNGAWQTVKVSKLPKYIWNGTAYAVANYYAVETGVTGDTKITYKKGTGTEGEAAAQATNDNATITIYNKDYAIDISIIKIDENTRETTQRKLPEAQFKLNKLTKLGTSSTGTYTSYPNDTDCIKTTNSSGTLTYAGLPDGKYRIDETSTPPGYVAYQKVEIYFTIENGEVSWTDSNGTVIQSQNLVSYAPTDKTYTVGNTPGEALPSTGGHGTTPLYLLGTILTILASAGLLMRKRNMAL